METRKPVWLAGGIVLSVFVVDCLTPLGWSIPLWYLPAILLTYHTRSVLWPGWGAAVCSGLTLIPLLFAELNYLWQMVVVQRLSSIVMFAITARFVIVATGAAESGQRLQAELRRQRAELDTILDALPALVFYKDRQERIVQSNAAHAHNLGRPKSEIIGQTDADLGSPYSEHSERTDRYVLNSGTAIRGLIEPIAGPEGVRWLQTDKVPVRDLSGEIIGLIGVAVDITKFKETEERLRDSEQNLSRAQRIAGMGSWTLELTDIHRIDLCPLKWSDEVFRIFGYQPGQIDVSNDTFFRAVHPDDRQRIADEMRIAVRDLRRYQVDHRIILPDGSERIVHEEADIFYDARSGRPLRMTGTVQDITERRWTQRLLEAQHEILEQIAAGLPLPEVLTSLVKLFEEQFTGCLCSILLIDDDDCLQIGAAPSLPQGYNAIVRGMKIGPAIGSCGTAAYRRERVIVSDIAESPLWEGYKDIAAQFHLAACWSVPILGADGRALGTFAIYSHRPRHPTEKELELVGSACHIAGVAIQRTRAVEALQAAETLFRNLVENTLVGIYILQDGRFAYVNPKFAEIFGHTSDAILAFKSFEDIVVIEDREFVIEQMRRRLSHDSPFARYEFRGITREGSRIDLEVRTSQTTLRGRPAVIGSLIDITERKRNELALRQSEERYRALVDNAPTGVFVTQANRFVYVNDAFCRLIGAADREQLLNQPLFDRIHPDCHLQIRKRIERIVSHGESVELMDQRYLRLDGRHIEVQTVAAPVVIHGQRAAQVMVNDVTDRKRVERRLKQATSRLGTLLAMSQLLGSSLELETLLEQLLVRLISVLPAADSAVLYLVNSNSQTLHPRAAAGVDAEMMRHRDVPVTDSIAGLVVESRRPLLLRTPEEVDAKSPPVDQDAERTYVAQHFGHRIQSKLCVPLFSKDGRVTGVMSLSSSHASFSDEDLSLLEAVTVQTSIAIQNADLYVEVRDGRERLQTLSRQLLVAQEAERAHIARELHDEVGQVLTAIGFHLHALLNVFGSEHEIRLRDDIKLIDQAIDQIRHMSLNLRPPALDVLGLEATLRAYVSDLARRTGLIIDVQGHLETVLTPDLEITCYRVIQTTLTNVVRHARAENVWVQWNDADDALELLIQDDGVGFDVADVWQKSREGRSFGLVGVQERVELVGGTFTVESTVGSGTTVRARFPLPPHPDSFDGQQLEVEE